MNSLKQAKYEVSFSGHAGSYFELPAQLKKKTDIVKICIVRYKDNVRQIASIFGEYLNYHDITDQGSLELIIMLKHMLDDKQKQVIGFYLYEDVLTTVVRSNTFEELYAKYKNKTVLNYLIDRQLIEYFNAFKINRTSVETIINDFINLYDPDLGFYLSEHKNMLNRFVISNEKKLTI